MFSPKEIAANYIGVAKAKTSLAWYKMLLLGILAGAFIAFGAVASTAASAGLAGAWGRIVKGAVFPVGLIMVIICGAELFTGNCLLLSPVIERHIKLTAMLKNWGLVYLGNLIGSVFIAVIVVYSHVQNAEVAAACVATAAAKSNMTFGDALLRGIPCNMLVCLAVWGAMASKKVPGKAIMAYFPVAAFVISGFEHSVANMYYLSAGLMAQAEYAIAASGLNVGRAILYCLLPSTLGNIIGGGIIAVIYCFCYRNKPTDATE